MWASYDRGRSAHVQMSVRVSVGMLPHLSGRADPRLPVDGHHRGKRQTLEQKSLDDVSCSPLGVRWRASYKGTGAHAFAGARAARGHLESLVVTRSVVSGMRSKHRSSPQCSECRLLDACGHRPGHRWLVATAVSATADRAVVSEFVSSRSMPMF